MNIKNLYYIATRIYLTWSSVTMFQLVAVSNRLNDEKLLFEKSGRISPLFQNRPQIAIIEVIFISDGNLNRCRD